MCSKRRMETINNLFYAIFFSFSRKQTANKFWSFSFNQIKKRFCVSIFHFDVFVFFCFVLLYFFACRLVLVKNRKKMDLRVMMIFSSFILLYGSRVTSEEENLTTRISPYNPILQWVPTYYSRDSGCG